MSPTVQELRNGIRRRIGRFEREVNAQFTKEELAAIAEAVGYDGRRPSKGEMRAEIRQRVGIAAEGEAASDDTFRKADLKAIAEALDEG
ncbi:hypothetical protein HWV23_15670 [Natronomonas halophila]|uniref:hypothetical protein n=1 Tax=Natronomonas halophila TaxID=2747817 RepID=UPI0015B454CF|nr:hypothetical protein [Natronomonas halophila]QLD87100.1 hypothetical protein HWV23_15670 [Natronomonas halophila]